MRFFIFLVFFLSASSVSAQVAQISAGGTTIYSRHDNVYIPNNRQQEPKPDKTTSNNVAVLKTATDKQETTADAENNKNLRGSLRSSGYQKTARNIMIVNNVAEYKLGDEQLVKYFNELQSNREYQRKMQKIRDNLQNEKIRNSKNREIIRILDDAGERIYNLLAH